MTASAMLHIRVDESLKQEAGQALEAMGLSLSDAVRLLLKRVAKDQAWPLELKVPNAVTQAAMVEARQMAMKRTAACALRTADELFAALDQPLAPSSKTPPASRSRTRLKA